MDLWGETVRTARWIRTVFERIAPSLAALLPWVGVALLLIAAVFAAHSWRFARGRVRSIATVTENIPVFARKGGILYYPRLRFRAANGEIVQVLAGPGTDEVELPAGETVPVLYMAAAPQDAIIATAWRAYHAAIVLALWGTALFDAGWVLRVMAARRKAAIVQPAA
jgi:hypothetical protein